MVQKNSDKWGLIIFSLRGSVFPQAAAWALPATLIAVGMFFLVESIGLGNNMSASLPKAEVWAAYNFFIGFLLTFRAGKSYTRWWEGATLLRQVKGEWCNAYSSLLAFSLCGKSSKDARRVAEFQKKLASLMSQLHCVALNTVSQQGDDFNVVTLAPLTEDSTSFLAGSKDKVEVIMLWIQRLIMDAVESNTLTVQAPILSRVFQELSRGVVNLNDVRKISDYLFPFPYAQLCCFMLLLHTVTSPFAAVMALGTWYWVGCYTFFSVFAFHSLNYVAMELECPFGDDENDLPLQQIQDDFNNTLVVLLGGMAQTLPFQQIEVIEEDGASTPVIIKDTIRSKSSLILRAEERMLSKPSSFSRHSSWGSDMSPLPRGLNVWSPVAALWTGSEPRSPAIHITRCDTETASGNGRSRADTKDSAGTPAEPARTDAIDAPTRAPATAHFADDEALDWWSGEKLVPVPLASRPRRGVSSADGFSSLEQHDSAVGCADRPAGGPCSTLDLDDTNMANMADDNLSRLTPSVA